MSIQTISLHCAKCGLEVGKMPGDSPLRQEHIHLSFCPWCKQSLQLTGTVGIQPVVPHRRYRFCRQGMLFDNSPAEYEFKSSCEQPFWDWVRRNSLQVSGCTDFGILFLAFKAGADFAKRRKV